MAYRPDPAHLRLGAALHDEVLPARFPKHILRFRNQRAAAEVGLDALDDAAWEAHFARFEPLPENLPRPLALRYHGHQFRHYNPQLGDGRGFLFAQLRDRRGRLLDLGTKGSGTTPWSRGGDGRLTLIGGVREVLAAELLQAHGVPTCRIFSLFETGEILDRHDEPDPVRSSVLVRLSWSHVRIGTFQRLRVLGDAESLARLVDHVGEHYLGSSGPEALLRECARRLAITCAGWMVAGFVHGVLNSDNMNVTGESFDYGPWRFLPSLDPDFTAAYFDEVGLYSYGRQPEAVLWNLRRLAESLGVPLEEKSFVEPYRAELRRRFLARMGLGRGPEAAEDALIAAATTAMMRHPVGFEEFFARWEELEEPGLRRAAEALPRVGGGGALPTLLNEEVVEIATAIREREDWGPFELKVEQIREAGVSPVSRRLCGEGEDGSAPG